MISVNVSFKHFLILINSCILSFLASSRRSEAYEQGLNDMADLMTTVDLDEAEKRRLRERFALQ